MHAAGLSQFSPRALSNIRTGIRLYLFSRIIYLIGSFESLSNTLRLREFLSLRRFSYEHPAIRPLIVLAATWLSIWFITAKPDNAQAIDTSAINPESGELSIRQWLRLLVSALCAGLILDIVRTNRSGLVSTTLGGCALALNFLFYQFLQFHVVMPTGRLQLIREAAFLKWIVPVVQLLGPMMIFLEVFLLQFHVHANLSVLYVINDVLLIALSGWVIAFFLRLLQALNPTPNQDSV